MKLRDVTRRIGILKSQEVAIDRAFGGLNVIMAGDFWQLDPPDGGFLAAILAEFIEKARKFNPAVTMAHGQAIFWDSGPSCVQGMTELTEVVRCKDPWLREVQDSWM